MKLKGLLFLCSVLVITACGVKNKPNNDSSSTPPSSSSSDTDSSSSSSPSSQTHDEKRDLDYEYHYSADKTFKYFYSGEFYEYPYSVIETARSSRVREQSMYSFQESDFTNKLPEPSKTIKSRSEFANYLDFAAFYQRTGLVLTVDYDFEDIEVEIHKAFWEAKTLSGVVGMDYGYDLSKDEIYINLFYNPDANCFRSTGQQSFEPAIPYSYYPVDDSGVRSPSNTVFPYQTVNTKGTVDVYNSEQLIYALENGYIPNCLSGSPAETIFNQCKYILNGIIDNHMTDMDKMTAIFSWILSNTLYDMYNDYFIISFNDEEHFPDEMASCFESMYAEGSIFGGYAVCQGYSKGFNLLATIEGIDATKVSACYDAVDNTKTISPIVREYDGDGNLVSLSYSSHGYSYVLDPATDRYYLCDPTYTWNGTYDVEPSLYYTMFCKYALMVPADYWQRTKYRLIGPDQDAFRKNHADKMATECIYDYRNNFKMKYNTATFDALIDSADDVNNFATNFVNYCKSYNNSFFRSTQAYYSIPVAVSEPYYEALRSHNILADVFDYWYYENMSFEEYEESLDMCGIINYVSAN